MKLRVATFNVENLTARWREEDAARADSAAALSISDFDRPRDRDLAERSLFLALEDDKRQMTALAIAETRADIICLQEVDSLRVLEAFFANYVHRVSDVRYGHFRLVTGNDTRGIDVAVAIRRDLVAGNGDLCITSHAGLTYADAGVFTPDLAAAGVKPQDRVFKRDCLMVDLVIRGRPLTIFICHFKSMNNGREDGRGATHPIRFAEARAVRRIVEERFGPDWASADWIIAGDLNDYVETVLPGGATRPARPSAIDVLADHFCVNILARLPEQERWTHFYRSWRDSLGRIVEEYVQLDYLLLSPALAARETSVEVLRRGLPYRVPVDVMAQDRSIAARSTAAGRYPRIGWDRPKASDHCPVVAEITLGAKPSRSMAGRDDDARSGDER